jgi:hypothetical protein
MKAWLCSFVLGLNSDPAITYTLYRSSVVEGITRIHVATFNVDGKEAYNEENCRLAANLFQAQPGVKTRFWCEKGFFKN